MRYITNPSVLAKARIIGEIEKMRKMNDICGAQNTTHSVVEKSSEEKQETADLFDLQFGSGWKEEPIYREGFKRIWQKK